MSPNTRKRKAPTPSTSASSSSEEDQSRKDFTSTSTSQLKYKCPVKNCGKKFKSKYNLGAHYRTHTKVKPYKCTFSSCYYATTQMTHLITHIRNVHKKQTKKEAEKYVEVQKEELDEEDKQLGINESSTEDVYDQLMSKYKKVFPKKDDKATEFQPKLPHFTTIQQTSTGHFICPFSLCNQKDKSLSDLKIHYRVHCSKDFQPFRCKFLGDSCRYASIQKSAVKRHVQFIHNPKNNAVINASDFVETRTDWLQMEDDLFSNAQIVNAPEIQKPQVSFECTFLNCSKKFTTVNCLRTHRRTHTQSKPFRCAFLNCNHTASLKSNMLYHILSVHFKIPKRECKNLSNEEKQKAEQYVIVDQKVLDEEEAQIAMARNCEVRKKPGHRSSNRSSHYNIFGYESLDVSNVQIEEDTTEYIDDKDELAAYLATVQTTTLD